MLSKYPLFKVFLTYVLGVILFDQYQQIINLEWALYSFLTLLILVMILKSRKKIFLILRLVLVLILFAALGYINSIFHKMSNSPEFKLNEGQFVVEIIETPSVREKSVRVLTKVLYEKKNNEFVPVSGKLLIYIEKEGAENILTGDHLLIAGSPQNVKGPKNPYEFNYKLYLSRKYIYATAYVQRDEWCFTENSTPGIRRWASVIQNKILSIIKGFHFNPREEQILMALLAGDRDSLSDETQTSFSNAGVMHVLAVSGLHVGILYLLLSMLFKPLLKFKIGRNSFVILVIIGIWFYAFVTGLSTSVTRAATMFSFMSLGGFLKRETNIYNTILASAFLLVLINPNVIFEIGFQLSYAAVIGIVYFYPRIYALVKKPKWLIFDKSWSIVCVSIAAQIGTLPLAIYYFHKIPLLFIVSNLIVIPAVWLIMVIGLASLIIYPILRLDFLLWPLNSLTSGMNLIIGEISKVSYSMIDSLSITLLQLTLMYAAIFLFSLGIEKRRFRLVALASLSGVIFSGYQVLENYNLASQNEVCIYSLQHSNAISFRNGRDLILVADTNMKEETAFNFSIEPHIQNLNLLQFKHIPWTDNSVVNESNFYYSSQVMQFLEYRILWLDRLSDTCFIDKVGLDLIVVNAPVLPFETKVEIILGNGLEYKTRAIWKEKYPMTHDLNELAFRKIIQ